MSKKVAVCGMLVALAFLLSYLEMLLPFSFAVPGIKLGLANLVTVIALYSLGDGAAFAVSMVRILLSGLTFQGLSVMLYSLAGGLFSFFVMAAGKRYTGLSVIGISILGGVTHNLGQLLLAALVLKTDALLYYFPPLMLAGTVAGLLIGLMGGMVIRRILPYLSGRR